MTHEQIRVHNRDSLEHEKRGMVCFLSSLRFPARYWLLRLQEPYLSIHQPPSVALSWFHCGHGASQHCELLKSLNAASMRSSDSIVFRTQRIHRLDPLWLPVGDGDLTTRPHVDVHFVRRSYLNLRLCKSFNLPRRHTRAARSARRKVRRAIASKSGKWASLLEVGELQYSEDEFRSMLGFRGASLACQIGGLRRQR